LGNSEASAAAHVTAAAAATVAADAVGQSVLGGMFHCMPVQKPLPAEEEVPRPRHC
jgi:hypothetical protein